MSLLPLEDAVRTSVLSKDWKFEWLSIYRIQIHDHPMKKASFVNFVNMILLHCQNIQSIGLSCCSVRDPTILETWISSLSMRSSIQSINIVSSDCGEFTLPHCLFDNTSLTNLELELPCTMKVPVKEYLCNLKFLTLSNIYFQNEPFPNTDRLILTFPVLKTLKLNFCTWGNVKFVEIRSPSLAIFAYMCLKVVANDFLIKICSAKLKVFVIAGYVLINNFDLNTSSIVRASILIEGRRCVHPFIRVSGSHSNISISDFHGLKYLELLGKLTKTYADLMPGRALPRFDKLKTLVVHFCSSIEVLIELLHMAPTLEKLTIHEYPVKDHDSEDYNNSDAAESVPSCMLSYLANIKFSSFLGTRGELNLVKFLLKNSVKLEKVVICVCSKPVIPKADIEEQLSTNPKGSAYMSLVVR